MRTRFSLLLGLASVLLLSLGLTRAAEHLDPTAAHGAPSDSSLIAASNCVTPCTRGE